jgi:hypothetical protein
LTIYRNQRYLTPELESLIRDFAYTYSAVQIGCIQGQTGDVMRGTK